MDFYDSNRGRSKPSKNGSARPFLGIYFKCCSTYGRIYKNRNTNSYRGNCPKCGEFVEVPIASGGEGTDQRFFSTSQSRFKLYLFVVKKGQVLVQQYIAPLWIVIFLFLALTVLFVLSKLFIIRNKLRTIKSYNEKIVELYSDDNAQEANESDGEV